jgi:arylsulfatase A-like enzyme
VATENLLGDDSRIVMDRAIPFIRENAKQQKPFFAVVWFHAPHWPVVAGNEHKELYKNLDDFHQNHFGCITALDEQVGRLRAELRELEIVDNTMLWFCSDNGPEGSVKTGCGSAGPFRGRKRDLYEGGVRVPGLLEWPGRFAEHRVISAPCSTLDYFPTILSVLGDELPPDKRLPFDGVNLLPILVGTQKLREASIGFQFKNQLAWTEDRFKLYSGDAGETWELYDLPADPAEAKDLSANHPERIAAMQKKLEAWRRSCAADLQQVQP